VKWDGDNFSFYKLSPKPGDGTGGQFDGIRWKLVQNWGMDKRPQQHNRLSYWRIVKSILRSHFIRRNWSTRNLPGLWSIWGFLKWFRAVSSCSKDKNLFTASYLFPEDYDDNSGKVVRDKQDRANERRVDLFQSCSNRGDGDFQITTVPARYFINTTPRFTMASSQWSSRVFTMVKRVGL